MNIGVLGCGNISDTYFQNLGNMFKNTTVYACCDLDAEKVNAAVKTYNIPRVMTFEEMLADPEIDIILNITPPKTHYSLSKKVLEAGKHVYMEKPLSITYEQGKELVALAQEKGLYIGCAPDTFMGAGIQTCIELIKAGKIGRPVGGAGYIMYAGPEIFHPDPAFFYDIGGGPLFDVGPYYITAYVQMLGRVKSVTAVCTRAFDERTVMVGSKAGQKIDVKVDTHNTGIIQFENGAVMTLVTSFDVIANGMPNLELYGTDGSIKVPDPNGFGGTVLLATRENPVFTEVPLVSKYDDDNRGMGLSDMISAIEEGRAHNASGALALHVLEVMEAFGKSSQLGTTVQIESSPSESIPMDWNAEFGVLKAK